MMFSSFTNHFPNSEFLTLGLYNMMRPDHEGQLLFHPGRNLPYKLSCENIVGNNILYCILTWTMGEIWDTVQVKYMFVFFQKCRIFFPPTGRSAFLFCDRNVVCYSVQVVFDSDFPRLSHLGSCLPMSGSLPVWLDFSAFSFWPHTFLMISLALLPSVSFSLSGHWISHYLL